MSEPNPNGNGVDCVKCGSRLTFSRDAICQICRRGGKTADKGHPKGER